MHKQKVTNTLRETNNIRRLEDVKQLLEADKAATKSALLSLSDSEDEKLRMNAIWALSLLPTKSDSDVVDVLVSHMKTDPNVWARISSAIGLMGTETPQVLDAYIHAANDENEKVARLACGQLGFRGGKEAIETLFQKLLAPLWSVRLEACKGLVHLKAADQRVVVALEKMAGEPEAKEYDAQIEEIKRIDEEVRAQYPNEPAEDFQGWGNLAEITEQARQIAAQNK